MGAFSDDIIGLAKRAAPAQAGIFSGDNPARYNGSDPIRLWVIQLVLIIGMTQLLALFLSRIRQPRVIAEIIGGVLLGPSVMGRIPNFSARIFPPESIPLLALTANIGLVLFLFLIGMELDIRYLKRNARSSALISLAGLVIPLGLGAALGVPIYHEFTDGTANFGYFLLFIAVAIGITAFPVLCRILTELKLLDTDVGVVVLSAGVGNDVVGWVLLALTVALVNASTGLTALWVLLTAIGFVIFLLYPVRLGYRWLAKRSGSLEAGSPSAAMMTLTVLIVFASAFFTDIIGVHAIFGGFLAGLIIPHDNGYTIAMVEKLEDLVTILLIPLYFALSGLRTNLGLLDNGITWGYVVLICVIAFFSKFLGCAVTAKLVGFNYRESGAIGSLMSCKGLVELIVLNVGLQAGILDTRTFSMFVLHALVLTFITTPLTLLIYPPRFRNKFGGRSNDNQVEDGANQGPQSVDYAAKTRIAVAIDRIEQLPAIMTLTQLLQPSVASSATSISSDRRRSDEKYPLDDVPALAPHPASPTSTISIDALRLIELTDRTSAVLKSQDADLIARSDPVLSIFRTFSFLNRFPLTTSLSVVGQEDFASAVAAHARQSQSQLVILPWAAESPDADSDVAAVMSPFDGIFNQRRENVHGGAVVHSQYIRRVFVEAPADVALFFDRGLPASAEGDTQHHIFLPFFGGPDDRLALAFVVQLCANPAVHATVVHVRKTGEAAPAGAAAAQQNTVASTAFPDTVYAAQDTSTRLASDTADSLLWTRLSTGAGADAELAEALGRVTFREHASAQPLHAMVEIAAGTVNAGRRPLLVAGRSRRMAVESHTVELRQLCSEHSAQLGELPRTLGDVAAAFVASKANGSLLVLQAARG